MAQAKATTRSLGSLTVIQSPDAYSSEDRSPVHLTLDR